MPFGIENQPAREAVVRDRLGFGKIELLGELGLSGFGLEEGGAVEAAELPRFGRLRGLGIPIAARNDDAGDGRADVLVGGLQLLLELREVVLRGIGSRCGGDECQQE